jgi:hypothetical protein
VLGALAQELAGAAPRAEEYLADTAVAEVLAGHVVWQLGRQRHAVAALVAVRGLRTLHPSGIATELAGAAWDIVIPKSQLVGNCGGYSLLPSAALSDFRAGKAMVSHTNVL